MSTQQLHFNAFIWPNGYHEAAWRLVDDDVRNVLGMSYYTDIARIAERGLMDSIFLADNIAIAEYRATHLPQTQFDPISVLSALAAVTSRIRLATGICIVPEHNPVVLAKDVATLDYLSRGRFILGVGLGWSEEEFSAVGIPFERRARRTIEYLEVMRRLWTEEHTTFKGEFVNLDGARSYPKPHHGAPPIFFGGESDAALRRVLKQC